MTSANDLLMGGGVKSAKFDHFGASVTGAIAREPVVQQQKDFDDGTLKFYEDGNPMMHIQVCLQTDQRDPSVPTDDGVRAVYLKGQLKEAVRDAVRLAGAEGLDVGGRLTVTYVSDGVNKRGRGKPPKQYTASYQRPSVSLEDPWSTPRAQNAPAATPTPTAGPAAEWVVLNGVRTDISGYPEAAKTLARQAAGAPAPVPAGAGEPPF